MLKLEDIKNVLIIGSGTLGLRVGLRSALSGYQVKVYDLNDKILQQSKERQLALLRTLVKTQEITEDEGEGALSHMSYHTDPAEAAADVDVMNESVTEDEKIKLQVYETFAPLFPSHTVLTTNTSFMLPSMFAKSSGRPGMFCALHFHDVFWADVVDIMPHPDTERWVVDLLRDFGASLKQTPIVMQKESSGYVFNAMLMAYLGAAGSLYTHDVASIHDVDRAWMGNTKMAMGPFGVMDTIGLDTIWHVVSKYQDHKSRKFTALLKIYVDNGKLGVKSGEGFYTYPKPAYRDPDFM